MSPCAGFLDVVRPLTDHPGGASPRTRTKRLGHSMAKFERGVPHSWQASGRYSSRYGVKCPNMAME